MLTGCILRTASPPPLAGTPVAAEPAKRIGYLHEGSAGDPPGPSEAAFFQGLADLRYVDGQNVAIVYRYTEGKSDLARTYAAELANLPVDVIVANGNIRIQAAKDATEQAAKDATKRIPIVMTNSSDPEGAGFVDSLARPGGNITGMSSLSTGLAKKRLELMREVAPGIGRLAVLSNPANPGSAASLEETLEAAEGFGVEVISLEVRDLEDLNRAFEAMRSPRVGALIALGDAVFNTYRREIAQFGIENQIPTHYNLRTFAVAGGLMVYGASFPLMFKRAATHVDRILKGAKPAELPVEQPTEFEFVINLSTARAIGVTIPPSLLVQATELIQ